MKSNICLIAITILLTIGVRAQDNGCRIRPADSYASAPPAKTLPTEITNIFPTAVTIKKTDKWGEVYDSQNNLLGYLVYSKPASNGITGYAGETPLLIALSTKQTILSVQLLTNEETPMMMQSIEQNGMLKQWNGLTPKVARKKKVDAVSGATYTSNAIIESFKAAIKKL